jgi:Thermopsin/Periplasmic copper-binding protein (NosD)
MMQVSFRAPMSSRWATFGAVFLATIMVAASLVAIASTFGAAPAVTPSVHASPTPSPSTPTGAVASNGIATPAQVTASSTRAAAIAAARNAFVASGGNLSDFHPPSINAPAAGPSATGGHIVPLYAETPAPMGIGSYGLKSVNGQIVPYIQNTNSIEGVFSTGDPWGVQDQAYDAGPQAGVGAQLNVIEVGTTLQGKQAFNGNENEFWLQNTLEYSGGSLSFDLNIWNFSYNPQGNQPWAGFSEFPTSTILHGNGRVSGGELYEEGGPKITVAYPFTLDVFINTTVGSYAGGPPVNEVYFNYTVINSAGHVVCPATGTCGSYDNVYFNSVTPVPAFGPGAAAIQENGYNYSSGGNGTNLDWEFDFGIGDSDAEIANIVYANATLGLFYNDTTAAHQPTDYQEVSSAYDFGSETGESTQGSYGTWTIGSNGAPVEHYRTGPSILQGLWNVSTAVGAHALNYANVEPENAWIAIAPGTDVTDQRVLKIDPTFGWFNRGTSNGGLNGFNTYLQPGIYTVEVMLSGYDSVVQTVDLTSGNVALNINLVKDPSSTVYTPIYIFTNAEMAAVATSGAGTAGNPYLLWNAQHGSLEPIFGDNSQWPFEVWEGIYVNATTAYGVWDPLPSLEINYPWWELQFLESAPATGPLPFSNQLQIYLYHSQNLTIWGSQNISGWFASAATGGYNIVANDVHNSLFGDNYFNVSDEGLELTGGGNNVVWGNTFDQLNIYNTPAFSGVEHPSVGLTVSESGDHIYNNAFYVNNSASSSTSYTDYWNVSCVAGFDSAEFFAGVACEPLSYQTTVNGFVLTGSIIGSSYQGGNYWATYGNEPNAYGIIPFVNHATSATGSARIGGITTGHGDHGDYAPLTLLTLDKVTISETGLPAGTTWTAIIYTSTGYPYLNSTSTTTSTSLVFYAPAGPYTYGIPAATAGSSHYAASTPATGSFGLTGSGASVSVAFVAAFLVTFSETGLLTGVAWRVVIAGEIPLSTTSASATIYVPSGSYTYTVPTVANYSTGSSGGFTVSGGPATVTLTFSGVSYLVPFAETGLARGTSWSVSVTEGTTTTTFTSTGTSMSFLLANGTYAYDAPATSGYAANPATGTIVVAGAPLATTTIAYGTAYTVTATETGLPITDGDAWDFNVTGQLGTSSSAASIALSLPNGVYTYTISSYATYLNPGGDPTTGYFPTPQSGTFTVSSAPKTIGIAFAPTLYSVTFEETGLPAGTSWSVTMVSSWINSTVSSTTSSIVYELNNGTYAWSIGTVAGYQSPSPGNFLLWGVPLVVELSFTPTYAVTFSESGLPGGSWNVTILHTTESAPAGTSIVFELPNGTYSYAVGVFNGFSTTQSGTVTVNGAPVSVSVVFAPVYYAVSFVESGLPAGTSWNVTIGATTLSSTGTTIVFSETNGTYSYTIGIVSGYATTDSGSVTVNGAAVTVPVPFTQVTYGVTFSESGLPSGQTFGVTFNGNTESMMTNGGTDTLTFASVPNGTYSYSIADVSGWHQTSVPYSGTETVAGGSLAVSMTFSPVVYPVTFSESGLPASETFSVTFNGVTMSTTTNGGTDTLTFASVPNGTYSYSIAGISGWQQNSVPYSGTLTASGSGISVTLAYVQVVYPVTFSESGLPAGETFAVTFNGNTQSTLTDGGTDTLTFASVPNGTYSYSIADVSGWHQNTVPYSGTLTAAGSGISVSMAFTQVTYSVTYSESGLPSGETFQVTLNSVTESLVTDGGTDSLTFSGLANGSYSYSIADVPGWHESNIAYSGSQSVSGASVTENLVFTAVTYSVTLTETGLPAGTSWTVTVGATTQTVTTASMTFTETNGSYTFAGSVADGGAFSGSFDVSGASQTVYVAFYQVTFTESGLPVGTNWSATANHVTERSTTTTIVLYLTNGTYAYSVAAIPGYHTTQSGSLTVAGTNVAVAVPYTQSGYSVKFTETGFTLKWKTTWCVTLGATNQCVTGGASMTFTDIPNGTYSYTLGPVANYSLTSPAAYTGTVTVDGHSPGKVVDTVATKWSLVKYAVKFKETGLPHGTSWQVTVDGQTKSTTSASMSFSLPNGTYSFTAISSGYTTVHGSVVVNGAALTHTVAFSPMAGPFETASPTRRE